MTNSALAASSQNPKPSVRAARFRGFSLMELVISMAAASFLLAGLASTLYTAMRDRFEPRHDDVVGHGRRPTTSCTICGWRTISSRAGRGRWSSRCPTATTMTCLK